MKSITTQLMEAGVTFQVTPTGIAAEGMTDELLEVFKSDPVQVWVDHLPQAMAVYWPVGQRYRESDFCLWVDQLETKARQKGHVLLSLILKCWNDAWDDNRQAFDPLVGMLSGIELHIAAREIIGGQRTFASNMDRI